MRKDKMKEHMKRMHSEERKLKQRQLQQLAAAASSQEDAAAAAAAAGNGRDQSRPLGGPSCNNTENQGQLVGQEQDQLVQKIAASDYYRFPFKCDDCRLGFKRRGMLVNHLVKRHPSIPLDSVEELKKPILKATKNYYCQYCNKVYMSSSKRKVHILKNHPGASLPLSARDSAAAVAVASSAAVAAVAPSRQEAVPKDGTFSATV